MPNDRMRSLFEGILFQRQHSINFTHGDFRPANIIVKNGKLSGIVDWEMSGWYPEYWEFVKALYVWRYQTDWADYLDSILKRYYDEYLAHQHFARMLW
jgi:aminoglycoside phosphotransferase (APT) family kinase protein